MTEAFCNFYVGQRVVYAPQDPEDYDKSRQRYPTLVFPKIGKVYTVREIFLVRIEDRVGLRLAEIVNREVFYAEGPLEPGFWHCDFKPVTDISELEKLLNVVPVKKELV